MVKGKKSKNKNETVFEIELICSKYNMFMEISIAPYLLPRRIVNAYIDLSP